MLEHPHGHSHTGLFIHIHDRYTHAETCSHTHTLLYTHGHTHTNTPFKYTYMHMRTWAHTNIHNQIQVSIHLIGPAYPGILKPSHSYTYNQICTLKDKLIPHTHITRHSTGLLTQRNTHLLRLRIRHVHLLTQVDMQSHTRTPVIHTKPIQAPTLVYTITTCSHTETLIHPQCPWTVTHTQIAHIATHFQLHIYTHAEDQMHLDHSVGPFPSTTNASSEKSTLYFYAST